MTKTLLSPKELAQAIGVSESSLKRWADGGRVRVSRTAGGHRRITLAEAIRFVRESRAPVVRPDILGLADVALAVREGDAATAGSLADQLYRYLSEGRAREARGLLTAAYLDGESMAAICDGPLRTAMTRLGDLFRHDERGVFIEHRATDIAIQAVQHLRTLIEVPAGAPVAVGGGIANDPYVLPPLVGALVLEAEGVQAVNLGPNTPNDALLRAVEQHEAMLAWLSITAPASMSWLVDQVGQMAGLLAARRVRLMVGGQQVDALLDLQSRHANLTLGRSMSDLVAEVRRVRAASHAAPAN